MTGALFVVDPLDGLDAGIDSSVGLMAATQDLGAEVWVCEPEDLALCTGRLRARARRITLRPRTARGDHRWIVDPTWYDEAERRALDVPAEIDVVFLRPDPPVDPRYLRTTYLLDVAAAGGVRVVNDPAGVRQVQEKLFPLRFPDLCPDTIVTADADDLRAFLDRHGAAVVKPVDGFSGIDVWLLRADDPNVPSLVESATGRGRRQVLLQQYLPAVAGGNKRLFVLDGEIIGAVDRLPTPDDFRIGPPSVTADPDARDRAIVAALAPALARHGIALAGLDVIDGRLIEVNVTCPGGMHKTDALLGTDLSGGIVRRLIAHPCPERLPA
ncbi:MAG TPA: glutathione synthase [Nocardioides sp.]|nr:glutathione synthase [Nocardioides sp.]